ncbi:MAG TPA: glycosyltransferase family 4 protein [Methanofastidiosum sp.]|nr:glycosyltransferase family 4 protein [Methanofastidiosum sp.]
MINGILWVYGHHEHSGYARNSREFIRALNHNGIPTKFWNWNAAKSYPEYETMHQYEAEIGFPYDIVIQNVVPTSFKRVGDKKNILMTVAETDSISQEWVNACNTADEVWTVSYYSQAALIHSGVSVPVRVVLMPIDIDSVRNANTMSDVMLQTKLMRLREDCGFVFFANSEWTPRKGWDILLKAFCEVFAPYEDVGLLIKTCCFSRAENTTSIIKQIHMVKSQFKSKCKIMLVNQIMDIKDVWHMYKYANAFILPSRGEGCGIPYMEAMACGLPIICPSRGGQIDYANDNIATRVNSTLVPAHRFPHNPNYDESMLWIDTDKLDLANKMMNLVVNQSPDKWEIGANLFEELCSFDGQAIKDFIDLVKTVIK